MRNQDGSKLALLLSAMALFMTGGTAATFTDDFSQAPTSRGWGSYGDTNLFKWDSTNQNLRVTWNSAQTNSFFHRSLDTVLAADENFSLSFDITLEDFVIGTTPGKPGTFEIAVGLLNLEQATQTNFFRGAGVSANYGPRNLVEFNFFPAWDFFLPTIGQVIVSTNNAWLYNDDNLMDLAPNETYHVQMSYLAATRTLTTVVSNNAAQYGDPQTITVPANFDFRVNTLAVSSYSDAIQPPPPGSILAHGVLDNFRFTVPEPPVQDLVGAFVGANWQLQFISRTNWMYRWERTTNFINWQAAANATPGTGSNLVLVDNAPWPDGAFYRVRANRP